MATAVPPVHPPVDANASSALPAPSGDPMSEPLRDPEYFRRVVLTLSSARSRAPRFRPRPRRPAAIASRPNRPLASLAKRAPDALKVRCAGSLLGPVTASAKYHRVRYVQHS